MSHVEEEAGTRLAKGQTEFSNGWDIAPPASNMNRLRYDCNLENHAIQVAHTCTYTHGARNTITHAWKNLAADPNRALFTAFSNWWSELWRNGMPSNMIFRAEDQGRVGQWATMAWSSHTHIGCAVARCTHHYFTVCAFGPGGNVPGQQVYQIGAPCTRCPGSKGCFQDLCLL
ncbi:SCP-like protein [Necator americanus]|uniref:SCP-like protein n=1 Tax=Necator americanus TaxID=51031 RepID=W2SQ24_NECAM|nr:SCP-like protein [Necator americanus]ETN70981.1 SCP-like protein [Necator americanus]